jgi:hypothetical protein
MIGFWVVDNCDEVSISFRCPEVNQVTHCSINETTFSDVVYGQLCHI